ncbi:MAG: metallophosphatase family protein [Chloroflexota bacterium]|nr:metallophosphatase family protein [Chloroflexota bacterium]
MRVLLVSDVHGNVVALEAVLAASPPFDALWNLGDTVGYGPRPAECLALLRDRGAAPMLAGNHDLAAVGKLDLAEFNSAARLAARWTAGRLAPADREALANLPSATTVDGFTLAHGSPRGPVWEYVLDAATATAQFDHFRTSVCFIGHTHVALRAFSNGGSKRAVIKPLRPEETVDLSAGRQLVNPGSVGQPRDGDPRAAFTTIDTERGILVAHRVPYDVGVTQRQMEEAALPPSLIARLARGI